MRCLLLLDVLSHDGNRSAAAGCGEVGRRPQDAFPVAFLDVGPFLAQQAAGHALETIHHGRYRHLGRILDQQMHMIVLSIHLDQLRLEIGAGFGKEGAQALDGVAIEHSVAVFRHKDQMHMHLENAVPPVSNVVVIAHRPRV
ncbi:conserved hypothetical protein [Thiomonas sp. CB2]|nr:conserved hypothetical protein [Thiomonas sp. CB2]